MATYTNFNNCRRPCSRGVHNSITTPYQGRIEQAWPTSPSASADASSGWTFTNYCRHLPVDSVTLTEGSSSRLPARTIRSE